MKRIAVAMLAALALAGCSSEPTALDELGPDYIGLWAHEFKEMPMNDKARAMLNIETSWVALYPGDQYEVCANFYAAPEQEAAYITISMQANANSRYVDEINREMVEDFLWKACRFK